MNTYAMNGHKVKLISLMVGYPKEQEIVKKLLTLDKEYTVEKTIVHASSTDVYLQEFPNQRFNSVFFEDVTEQSKQVNKFHKDWSRYNNWYINL